MTIDPAQPAIPLVVGFCEDDPRIGRTLTETLQLAGHRAVGTRSSAAALARFSEAAVDVLILDVGLPDGDGLDLCRALQANGQTAPVLFLTALGSSHDVVRGFTAGGMDYLVKPFAVPELLARVESLARRRPVAAPPTGLTLDPAGHRLRTAEGDRLLSPTEFRIVSLLLARTGQVVRRAELVNAAWTPGALVQGNTLDAYVHRLRRLLTELDSALRIETVRGVGYVLR